MSKKPIKDLSEIDPRVLWYVIGYIATDGSLSKDGRHTLITSKDEEHLIAMREELGVTSKIIKKSNGSSIKKNIQS